MSSFANEPEAETAADWEITPDGLYIATRGFLIRRGYCCANRCRNCPYINWRANPDWRPAPAQAPHRARVSPKTLAAARALLAEHQLALTTVPASEHAHHQEMIEHYQRLLERWW